MISTAKKYDTVLFDLDGTLLDTLDDLTDSVNYAMRKCGIAEYTRDQVKSFIGDGIRMLMIRCMPDGENDPMFNKAHEEFTKYYMEHSQDKTAPYDGIIEMLDALYKKGLKIGVASNKNDAAVKPLVEHFFGRYINVAVGNSPAVRRKPYPELPLLALAELNSLPQNTLYVGDSNVDKQTADNVGMDCVLVSWGFRPRENLEELSPLLVADFPAQITALFE